MTNRRGPKHAVDTEKIKIILCKFCREKITFSYGSVGRDGKKIACDLDGTMHVCKGGKR
jgi:hypothetical protein